MLERRAATSRALVRFPLPAGVPAGCVLESARLRAVRGLGHRGRARRGACAWRPAGRRARSTGRPARPDRRRPSRPGRRDGYMRLERDRAWCATMLGGREPRLPAPRCRRGHRDRGWARLLRREKGENPPELVIRFAAPPTGEPPAARAARPRSGRACGELLTRSTLVTNDLLELPRRRARRSARRGSSSTSTGTRSTASASARASATRATSSVTVRNGTVHGLRPRRRAAPRDRAATSSRGCTLRAQRGRGDRALRRRRRQRDPRQPARGQRRRASCCSAVRRAPSSATTR